MREHIEKRFKGWITWKFRHKPELQKFFLRHERLPTAIDKTYVQIRDALFRKPNTKVEFVAKIIDSAARFFCALAIEKKEIELNTQAARQSALQALHHDPKEKSEQIFDPDDKDDQKRLKQYLAPKVYIKNPTGKANDGTTS